MVSYGPDPYWSPGSDFLSFDFAWAKVCSSDKLRYGFTEAGLFVVQAKIGDYFEVLLAQYPDNPQPPKPKPQQQPKKRGLRDFFGGTP